MNFRLGSDFSKLMKFNFYTTFCYSITTICVSILLIQMELVE